MPDVPKKLHEIRKILGAHWRHPLGSTTVVSPQDGWSFPRELRHGHSTAFKQPMQQSSIHSDRHTLDNISWFDRIFGTIPVQIQDLVKGGAASEAESCRCSGQELQK